jgi:SET domain-containing protein|tara:strand:- start:128 stop:418 length:291 start_codon:yes stop_codon:yes gene_type:complete
MYRPLPENLTIKESTIEGIGLFAVKDIAENTDLGITHILNKDFKHGYIRTPLGGFINHSDTPNAELVDLGSIMRISTITSIESGEEIKIKYRLYKL